MTRKMCLYESPEMVVYALEVQGCIATSVTDSPSGGMNGFEDIEIDNYKEVPNLKNLADNYNLNKANKFIQEIYLK